MNPRLNGHCFCCVYVCVYVCICVCVCACGRLELMLGVLLSTFLFLNPGNVEGMHSAGICREPDHVYFVENGGARQLAI